MKRFLQKSRALINTTIKVSLAYKFEMLLTVFFGPLSLLVTYLLWKAIFAYNGAEVIGGFTFDEMVAYYVLSWFVFILRYNDIEDWIIHDVRMGNIVKNLVKPVGYIMEGFLFTLGHRSLALFIEAIPILIIGVFLFKIKVIWTYLILFLISVSLALLLNYFICCIVGMTSFWIVHSRGLSRLKRILISFLSGNMIPLTFFPLAFQNISFYLPFQYLTYVPINIFLGKYSFMEIFRLFSMEIAWIIVFYAMAILVYNRAIRRSSSVGI